jgi:hypothetical protein
MFSPLQNLIIFMCVSVERISSCFIDVRIDRSRSVSEVGCGESRNRSNNAEVQYERYESNPRSDSGLSGPPISLTLYKEGTYLALNLWKDIAELDQQSSISLLLKWWHYHDACKIKIIRGRLFFWKVSNKVIYRLSFQIRALCYKSIDFTFLCQDVKHKWINVIVYSLMIKEQFG